MKMCGVYIIKNLINKKLYFGSSNDIKRRFKWHIYYLKKGSHYNIHLQNSWNRDGEKNFSFEIFLYTTEDKRLYFEALCIEKYNTFNREFGYNLERLDKIQDQIVHIVSNETRKKLSLIRQGIDPLRNKTAEEKRIIREKIAIQRRGKFILMPGIILNEIKVYDILKKWFIDGYTRKEIMEIYPIKGNTISSITTGKKWKRIYEKFFKDNNNINPTKRCEIARNKLKFIYKQRNNRKRFIERIDPNTGEIKEYISISAAAEEGFIISNIIMCCQKLNKQNKPYKHMGYYWKYFDDNG